MGRTNLNNPDFIICSDIHLMETIPICRTDKDFFKIMWDKLDFISELQKKYQCKVVCAGDLFEFWKPSPDLLSKTASHIPDKFYTIYGQHDLPQHNLDLAYKSGLYNLWINNKVNLLFHGHWGQSPATDKYKFSNKILHSKRKIFVWHNMTYKGKPPWPGCTDTPAKKVLKKYPQFDLIITGDNHKTFIEEYKGRLLVNPGSMLRSTAAQINHKPCVFLYYAKTNTVEQVFIPITPAKKCISRKHIDGKIERDNRIDAFVSRLDTDWKKTMSFEDNLQKFYSSNNTKKSIKQIVTKVIE